MGSRSRPDQGNGCVFRISESANLSGVESTDVKERFSVDAPGNSASLCSLPPDMSLDSSVLSRFLLYPSVALLNHFSFVPLGMGEPFLPL